MRVRAVIVGLVAFGVLAAVPPSALAGRAACPNWGTPLEPSAGRTLLLIGESKEAVDAYAAPQPTGTGNTPGGVMVYSSVTAPQSGLVVSSSNNGFTHDMAYELTRFPNSTIQIGLNLGNLSLINVGALDAQIDQLGQILRNTGRPIYLRIGYEFDLASNGYEPAAYKKAFQRIVEHVRAQGGYNVSFVWHSVASGTTTAGLNSYYPGDCYVDWAGVSLFGQPYTPAGMAGANTVAAFADAHQLPIMIAESSPYGRDVDAPDPGGENMWNDWFVPVVNWIGTHNVKAWSYINMDWTTTNFTAFGDSRIEANPVLEAHWLAEIAKPRYISASASLWCGQLGWCGF